MKQKVLSLNKKGGSLDGKCDEIKFLIAKHSLKRAMEVIKNEVDGVIELVVDKEDLDSKREKFGFFALFTHCDMTPAEMINVYKSRDLVEKGIQNRHHQSDEALQRSLNRTGAPAAAKHTPCSRTARFCDVFARMPPCVRFHSSDGITRDEGAPIA